MVHVVDAGVLALAIFFLRYPPEVQYLHVNVCSNHPKRERVHLHEGLLKQVCEKIPVLFCEGSGPQTPLNAGAIDKEAANNDCSGREEIAGPLTLLVNHDEKG